MNSKPWIAAVTLLVLASFATAKITDAEIRKDDRALILLDEPFGFGPGGRINITMTNFQLRPIYNPGTKEVAKPRLSKMGVILTLPGAVLQLDPDIKEGKCALDSTDLAVTLFFLDEIDLTSGSIERDYVLNDLLEDYMGGEFMLYFVNCEPNSAVDFDIRLALLNAKGDKMDYLPVGQDMLPFVYLLMFLLFTGMGGLWVWVVVKAKHNAHKIHYLMVVLVAFKSLTLLTQAGMYHMIALVGHPEGWNVAYYIFTFLRGILFFVVIILISTGWSYMKPFLAEREKNILLFVVPLQVFANVAIVVTDEFTPAQESWVTWRDIWHIIDILCCCAILFPIVWSIKHLRDASEIDGKAARVLSKLVLFRQFYIMVVSYIYFTRIIVYLLDSTLPFQYIWLSNAANELATLAFYVACGMQFKPLPAGSNPYFALEQDEVEMSRA